MSGSSVGARFEYVMGLVRQAVSVSTWRSYQGVWREWHALVYEVGGCSGLEDRLHILLYFLGKNCEAGVSVSVVNRKMAGLAFLFKMAGVEDVTKSFMVRMALRGYRRGRCCRDARRPVSLAMLTRLAAALLEVCRSPYEVSLFCTAFVVAFFGALRIGELVSPAKRTPGGLDVGDVRVHEDCVTLWIRRSKTDQVGRGAQVVLGRVAGMSLCPVLVVSAWVGVRPVGPGPFLIHENGSALSRFQFQSVFQRCLIVGGYLPSDYSSHSFRIGAAMEAARWGLSDQILQRLYVRPHLL